MTEREQLEQAIATLETQRAALGDAVVEPAIAALREKLAALNAPPASPPLGGTRGGGDQQRKQITVLFADISGFTAMSETMDAEDVVEIMNALWERLDRVIIEHDGTIDKHMGDAVMGLWGAETAREDDPECAIRAALAMQVELAAFRQDQQLDLAMRIGLNTGPVILSEVGTTGEYSAIGNTVNTAGRLEHAAPVGGILISHDTYRHVRGAFDVQVLEPIQVKGKAEPVQVYVVQQAKPRAFRKGTRGVEGVETRMIGRDAELKQLQDAFYTVIDPAGGERQMVTITGEAGVGKTRLLYEFDIWSELQPERFWYLKGRANQEMQNAPYALIRDLFSFRFQIQDSDQARVVWEKMEQGVAEALGEVHIEQSRRGEASQMRSHSDIQMRAHFIGQLLGFDFSDSPHLEDVLDDAQQIHDRALIYIGDYFKAIAARYPVLVLLEDLHWADESSLDVLNQLALATSGQPLLILCAARPELYERRPHWCEGQAPSTSSGQAFHTRMELSPLSKRDSRQLVEEILQLAEHVPETLRELVVSGAEGNPFYVEELIKMLIEDGVIVKGEGCWQVEPTRLTAVRVPPTLTGVLQARLDSLSVEERTILQQASVVGRIFWDDTVERISESASRRVGESASGRVSELASGRVGEREVPRALSALRDREMVFQQETSTFAETREFIFKHAILRDVTYESVLKRVRRVYHRLVAEWLIEHSDERAGEVTGVIADHLELAGESERAVTYLRQAGERAAAQYANAEAVNYFSRALNLIPETDATRAEQYALLLAREEVYHLQGERETQVQDLMALARLAEALNDDQKRAQVALRQANYYEVTGDFPAAIAAAQEAVRWAQMAQDVSSETTGYLRWGVALMRQGENEAAQTRLAEALNLAREAQMPKMEANILRKLGGVSFNQGDFADAKVFHEKALHISREIGDQRGAGRALQNLGGAFNCQGDFTNGRTHYEQALQIHRKIGDRLGECRVLNNLGAVAVDQGDYTSAKAFYQQALRISCEIGHRLYEGALLGNLGEVSLLKGDYTEAGAYLDQALCILREIGHSRAEGWVSIFLGEVSLAQGDYAGARAHFEQALHINRDIGERLCEDLTLSGLSLLSHHLGDDEAAREYSQQALRIAQELDDRPGQGNALMSLGHALVGLGQPDEAADAYEKALVLRREIGQAHLAMEAIAGLAFVSLNQQELCKALDCVEKILNHLETGSLDGVLEPFQIYQTCYRVLHANQDPRAEEVLNTAHTLLQERAAKIEDEDLRRSFLENVAAHREIVSAWRAVKGE